MVEKYKNYINGEWIADGSLGTFKNINPANTDDIVGEFPSSGKEEVDAAVAAAKEAFKSWRLVPAPKRADIIKRAGDILVERKEELARLMTREMGKILIETRGDVQEGIDTAYYAAGEGRRMFGDTVPCELPNKFGMSVRMPIGVCGMITPWNFPIAIPTWKIFPALVCGNTVVFKPASDTPASAVKLVEILEEAGIPKGVVNLVNGTGKNVGEAILHHPDVALVAFTGSSEIGRHIAEVCGKHLKRVSLELGGKNGQIVMDDANLELALEGALWGAFGTTGQRCTATSRIILHRKIADEFIERFVQLAQNLKIGNGLDESVQMGPLINQRQREIVHNYVEIGKNEDKAKLLIGGEYLTGGEYDKGFFYKPTVFVDVKPDMRIAKEEIFGPVVAVFTVDSFDEAIDVINSTSYGLSSSIYTQDVNQAFRALRDIETGITYVNGPTIGAEIQLPFGGVKDTGNGHRESSHTVLDIFTEWKSIYVDYSGKLQRAQIDTYEE
ncbi:aldehyde dehydrogenase family protein [Candidatus Sumerlaeota bacterium]|nr:aldehyde dehydrogenase family protein [Candidatus Sumerlaeota bacterium]